ncbi:MAG TPA: amino acid adenylation domain-containing protein [Steroidobacteraceae bacterium]|nr:amino acid adenylation domain-containing protein [Steroidobacteraceae bacterium]
MPELSQPPGGARRTLADTCVPAIAPGTAIHEFVLEQTLADALRRHEDPRAALLRAWNLTVAALTGEDGEASTGMGDNGVWCFDGASAPEALLVWRTTLPPRGPLALRVESTRLEESTLAALAGFLVRALGQPGAFCLLDADARQAALHGHHAPLRAIAAGDTVHALFSAQARRTPDAPALAAADSTLTYAELDRRSSAWAAALHRDIPAGATVAVLMQRSADAIVALLAILKAGATYLPLDQAYPPARLRFMLEDSGASLLLTDGAAPADILPAGVRSLGLADLGAATGGNIPDRANTDDVAYVMYTSGSTGTPKGAEIPHAAIVRLVRDPGYIRLDASTVFLHAAPLGFDASTLEIWGPLLNGGCCVVHDEILPTGSGLAATVARHGVTSAWLTAALFNAIVDENPAQLAGIAELLTGGEALSVPHVRRACAALPSTQLINGYGPTESTTFAATWRIPRSFGADNRSVPIGRAIPDTTLYILNRKLEPVPDGFIGELFIGGRGLARGYRNRPELNEERFVADPFAASSVTEKGARLYRTGDLVRRLPDGNIEFIGRGDGQVKIRGFRIEVGEIEACLREHPGVRSGAVVVREDRPGDRRLVAYVVADDSANNDSLRAHVSARLPEFMRPAAWVRMQRLPITANGKLDRAALPVPTQARPELAQEYRAPANGAERSLATIFSGTLGVDGVGAEDNFFELGGNSLLALRALTRIRETLGAQLSTTTFFQRPTPAGLARAIAGIGTGNALRAPRRRPASATLEPVAIVGMAGRFPGANDVAEFWRNLCAGRESISFFTPGELDASLPASLTADPNYIRARGVLAGVENFDAGFFGIGPKEAELMDPQQRKFLEICWECLEHGGYVPDAIDEPVGVFAGMYNSSYFQKHVLAHRESIERVGEFQVMLANEKDYIATRVAHKLNLTGPAISVHTACSTSLVAVAQAFDSLRSGQCHMALAGGVAVTCPPSSGYLYQDGAMLSPDGHTRSFDVDAQGTVFSDGAAVVLLKRLSDALADGDTVYAVIRGAAVNNDGAHKASFTAPSATAQARVIAAAQECAGVEPRSITYVEAHGTATPLGDPIEVEALTQAFRSGTADRQFCALGSVKSNVGHLVIAAGAAGLIKTALAARHGVLPPSINFRANNPKIDFAGSPFYVNDKLADWRPDHGPRRAGVSSFGVGGTNAHVIVEEPPAQDSAAPRAGLHLLTLSARNEGVLDAAALRLAAHLRANPDVSLADAAHTLRVGRKNFQARGFVVASGPEDAVAALESPRFVRRRAGDRAPEVVFLFPGQGAQYPGMGAELYRDDAVFREHFDACAAALQSVGLDIKREIFDGTPATIAATAIAQPATFVIEYCLAQVWLARGLEPAALIGHSVGEFVAAVLAGVMTLTDALRLVATRGRLMQAQPAGSMLSVRAPAAEVAARLPTGLSLAAENSPLASVVSGPAPLIESFAAALESAGIANRMLQTSHAFHSAMMDAVVAPFGDEVRKLVLRAPALPIISTATGELLPAALAMDPGYWSRHLREPVKFSPALRTALAAHPGALLLEIGPRNMLSTLARQHFPPKQPQPEIVASGAEGPDKESAALVHAIGLLWAAGVALDTRWGDGSARRRIGLPGYPFEARRHWVSAASSSLPTVTEPTATIRVLTPLAAPKDELPPSSVSSLLERQPTADVSMPPASSPASRRDQLITRLCGIVDQVVGIDVEGADPSAAFVELGLDSLALTQVALQLQKAFGVKVTFRQLMESYSSLGALAAHLDASMPPDAAPSTAVAPAAPQIHTNMGVLPSSGPSPALLQTFIEQQMQLLTAQMALLRGTTVAAPAAAAPAPAPAPAPAVVSASPPPPPAEDDGGQKTYDVKKAFGAIARIHTKAAGELTERQKTRLSTFMRRYIARTKKSKDYTTEHRAHLADPRVVNGFRPQLKEIIYQIVIDRSKGSHVWDLDGNEYIDALNGFGMSLFGWQPDFVLDAVREQLDKGYEIGPQHPLAGEVAKLVCELTGFDRAGLCNTGSEAVMGCLRIARTVTGRSKIALFTGSYHGIFDEVIVRGARKLRAVPAAPGIMPNTSENVLVLDYGTPESLQILREHADELAAVLIEPVQSRRPDFQPREFLKELREITRASGTLFIFDEVVTGFRSHPRGAQAVLGIDADLASYGKVVGGGFPIGVIAGKREYMDALDGGGWQFGDDSIPTVGVTYFAGTFVRHPLALAAAHAVLIHLKKEGGKLQDALNARVTAMVAEMNAFCRDVGAPITLKNFSSVWKLFFDEDHPLQDLLFAMMRERGIHILDNFPCFMTTAHTDADIAAIVTAFKEAVRELQEADFIPRRASVVNLLDASKPPVPGARLGRDVDGTPAWFMPNPDSPGKFVKVNR